ncbi:recombinase family protein [Sphingomonas sp. 22R3R2A-7]|uniref:recombinase family protein n=1 Tax=Sphingomonas sp. 22R3R2A-7 TaxID=3050230 RepID=UPI003FA7367A
MRVLLYARCSTDLQDPLSIDTQLTMCRRELAQRKWTEVGCYTDGAQSGATIHRAGLQALLAAVETGGVDVVFADAMDRVSRSQADIASLYERLKFRGILLVTRKEGEVGVLQIGMMGTINAEQIAATSLKTRDALIKRHAMGKNPGGTAYGYEKRIAYDLNGERTRGLQQIVPAQAAIVVRIFEDYAAGISPGSIVRRLTEEGVPPPRSGRRDRATSSNPPAWTPNTLTGNAERGTGILNNQLHVGRRAYARQTYRKNPDTGKRHAFLNAEEQQATTVAAPDLRSVSDTLWQSVKDRQQSLRRGPRKARDAVPALPFFAQQRPKYLTSGKMTCAECGSSYAKSGRTRFGCQGASEKGSAFCENRLTIRQDDLDARILSGLANEMVRDEVLAVLLEEYAMETARLKARATDSQPQRDLELMEIDRQIALAKAAILKGVDASMFTAEMRAWAERRSTLLAEAERAFKLPTPTNLLHADLGNTYRQRVGRLTDAFEDDALRSQAFERIRSLIETVVLKPENGVLAIYLRGEFASMLELCVCPETQKASAGVSGEALQIKMVAGTGFEPVTFRL